MPTWRILACCLLVAVPLATAQPPPDEPAGPTDQDAAEPSIGVAAEPIEAAFDEEVASSPWQTAGTPEASPTPLAEPPLLVEPPPAPPAPGPAPAEGSATPGEPPDFAGDAAFSEEWVAWEWEMVEVPATPAAPPPPPAEDRPRTHFVFIDRDRAATPPPESAALAPAPPLEVSANVSQASPCQRSAVTVSVHAEEPAGGPVEDARVESTWNYRTTTSHESNRTDASGDTNLTRRISTATPGHPVVVDVVAQAPAGTGYARTSFTPVVC